ncbi:MAG: ECF transporter S component [Anaerolineae bacterium]|nr:ECF transporter S component [Anaerolineae bacterium]
MSRPVDVRRITLTALMAALIFVLTRTVQIATPAQGYIHLGDAGIVFAALAFGPGVAAVAGGLGTALADITSGYMQWALFSFLVHGIQGWIVGAIINREANTGKMILAAVLSALIVIGGYFVAGMILVGIGGAVSELLPNMIQGISGGLVGVPLYLAVRRAYPTISRYKMQV